MAIEQTWAEQLEASSEVDIRLVPEGRKGMTPGKSMLYPSATMLNDAIRAIPAGESITGKELKARLAARHDTYYVCPVTATKALRIVAEAANEAYRNGAPLSDVTPIWRVLDRNASALRKLTFDPAYFLDERAREGLTL